MSSTWVAEFSNEKDYNHKEKTKKYARVFYKIEKIFSDRSSEVDDKGFVHKDGGIRKYQLEKACKVLDEEGIEKIEEMITIIMDASKGYANPKMVKEVINERR